MPEGFYDYPFFYDEERMIWDVGDDFHVARGDGIEALEIVGREQVL
ncbi:MAG: hypothetical protein ACE5LG_00030 [Anaerolineae bacterium]